MYVIFPADEVVYLTYGINSPPVRPRPTLDHLLEPQVSLRPPTPESPPASTTESTRNSDIFNYTGPDVNASRTTSPPPSRPPSVILNHKSNTLEKPKEKKHRFPLRLKKSEDPNFGRTVRSPHTFDFEQPVPLATPAFSKHNIFQQNFDALFEVSNTPEFVEHIRVVTPDPRQETINEQYEEECPVEDEDGNWEANDESYLPPIDYLKPPSLSAPATPRSERKSSQSRNSRKKPAIDKSSSLEGFIYFIF